MNLTSKGLKKPLGTESYNIEIQNSNMDLVDELLTDVDTQIDNIEQSINNIEVPVSSVNDKTGNVHLTASDIGAETPSGAQAKASAALGAANSYTDTQVSNAKGLIGTISGLLTTVKDNLVVAINEIFNDLKTHKAEIATPSVEGHVRLDGILKTGLNAEMLNGKLSNEFLQDKSDVFVTGIYTGDDASSRTINLGFTPSAVIVAGTSGFGTQSSGFAYNGSPVVYSGKTILTIVTGGFTVYGTMTNYNASTQSPYRYLAFK